MARSSERRGAETAATIEVGLVQDVEKVLEKLYPELDAAVWSGLASAAPTAQTGSGRRPRERGRTARSFSTCRCGPAVGGCSPKLKSIVQPVWILRVFEVSPVLSLLTSCWRRLEGVVSGVEFLRRRR